AFDTVGINSFQALQAPFMIDSVAFERKVLASDIPQKMLSGLKPAGLVGLAILPGPVRRPLGVAKPLASASSYRGARIGIRASQVSTETVRALGAIPVVLPHDSNLSGLDGLVSDVVTIDAGYAERGATVAGNINFEPRPNVIFVNQHAF